MTRNRILAIGVLFVITLVLPLAVLLSQREQQIPAQAQAPQEQSPRPRATTNTAAPVTTQQVTLNGCAGSALQIGGGENPLVIPNPICLSGIGGLNIFITWSILLIFIFATIASFFMLLWGGVSYIMSQGDPKATAGARSRITYALFGLGITLSALLIFNVVSRVLGLTILQGTTSEAINEAVVREQENMQARCNNILDRFGFDRYQACLDSYCSQTYANEAAKQRDCMELSRGILTDAFVKAVQREIADWEQQCANSITNRNPGALTQCLHAKCDAKYLQNRDRWQDCRNLVRGR